MYHVANSMIFVVWDYASAWDAMMTENPIVTAHFSSFFDIFIVFSTTRML